MVWVRAEICWSAAGGLTPGLINTRHHFYQWITRGLATGHSLFD
ncbi:hypothetical protein [Streptomyces sp. NPDC059894]